MSNSKYRFLGREIGKARIPHEQVHCLPNGFNSVKPESQLSECGPNQAIGIIHNIKLISI